MGANNEVRDLQVIDRDYEISPAEARHRLYAIAQFQGVVHELMVEGHDYGAAFPGSDKPSLLKPGAEKLVKLMNCTAQYEVEECKEDWEKPFFYYRVKCRLVSMDTGVVVSEGMGSANSYESKWRYRWLFESDIPSGVDKKSLRRKEFFSKKNNRKYVQYRMENEDIYDQVNTILKIGEKRSLVDAALAAGRLSDLFTQDIEEMKENGEFSEAGAEGNGKPEPDEDERKKAHDKVLETALKRIAALKTIEELEEALAKTKDMKSGGLKTKILAALSTREKELQKESSEEPEESSAEKSAEEEEKSPESEESSPEAESGPTEADLLFAQIREALEAAAYTTTTIDRRMKALANATIDELQDVLQKAKAAATQA